MDRKAVCGIILTLLLTSMLTLAFNIQPVKSEPTTWTVDDDGPADFHTIQEAINAANSGDTIFVRSGTYYENVVVSKSLTIMGENRATTIIDGGGNGKVVEISANNIKLSGLTIRNGEYGIRGYNWDFIEVGDCNVTGNSKDGIIIGWSQWTVKNCTISFNHRGLCIDSGYNNLIENNTFLSNGRGFTIYLHPQWCGSSSPGNNILRNNAFANNTYGIELGWAGGNVLRGNIMTNNNYSLGISGGSIYSLINDIDSSNIIDGKPVYYLVNQRNLIINSSTFPSIGYLGIVNSTNITVKDITLLKNKQGLLLAYTQNSTIINVTTSENHQGITLIESTDNVLVKSRASGNTVGIFLWRSDNNKITETTLLNNEYGIRLWHSDNNTLYHNNFIENLIQVNDTIREWLYPWQYYYHYSKNIWDNSYPSGGNYWSDCTGVDLYSDPYQNETGSDGIGDVPYIIDENNVDNYPLMVPFSSYTITWNEETCPIDFVTNSTILNLSFDSVEKLLSFDVVGPANTLGMCRVAIPKSLMEPSPSEKWQITVDDSPPLSINIIEDMENTYLYFTYTHSTRKVEIRIVSQKTLLGRGWGWMRIAPKQYIHGPAKLYKIEENQIELTITHQGKEYSKTWKIIWHKEYRNHELYLCYSPKNGPLIVMLQKTRWKIWLAIGKNTIAYGFPRFQRPRLMRT